MRLVGMMDSPYVRRVAVSLKRMRLPFEHEPLSVFRDFEAFAALNPLVKAPTLICDDGTVLLDSTLILDHAESLAAPELRLTPTDPAARLRSLRLLGLALGACEKTVQIVYETNLRSVERQDPAWLERIWRQARAAFAALEAECRPAPSGWLLADRPLQADLTAAVVWRFAGHVLGTAFPAADHPSLAALSARAEALPEFLSSPLE